MGLIPEELLLYQIDAERKARESAIAELRTLLDGATGTFAKEIEGVAARLKDIDSVTGKEFEATALVGTIRMVQVEPGFARAEELTQVEATLTSEDQKIRGLIEEHRIAQVTRTEAMAQQHLSLTAKFNQNVAQVTQQLETLSTADTALAQRVDNIEGLVITGSGADTYVQDTAPVSPGQGDLWFDSDDGYKPYRYDSTNGWRSVRDADVALSVSRLNTIETDYATKDYAVSQGTGARSAAVADAKGYTDGQISSLSGVYVKPGQVSGLIQSDLTSAVSSANQYTDTRVLTRSKFFRQDTQPVATALGDVWVDTAHENKLYVWDGSAWQLSRDTQITTLGSSVSSLQSTKADLTALNTQAGRIDSLYSQINTASTGLLARVTTIENTYATDNEVSGSISTAISTEVTNRNSAITARVSDEATLRQTADGYLSGKRTIAINANGRVTGMEITSSTAPNGGTTSEIVFEAGVVKFYDGANKNPLLAGGAAADVNANGTVIRGAKIATGEITLSHLNFTPVQAGNVIASINASGEGLRIASSKITIDGSVSFANGYDPTTKASTSYVDSAVSGKANADLSNVTTIDGGKITTGTIVALGNVTAGSLNVGSGMQQAKFGAGEISQGHFSVTSDQYNSTLVKVWSLDGAMEVTGWSSAVPVGIVMKDGVGNATAGMSSSGAVYAQRFEKLRWGQWRGFDWGSMTTAIGTGTQDSFDIGFSANLPQKPDCALIQCATSDDILCRYEYDSGSSNAGNIHVIVTARNGGGLPGGTHRFSYFIGG